MVLSAVAIVVAATLFVVGAPCRASWRRRDSDDELTVDEENARRDVLYFLLCFSLGAGAGLVPLPFYLKAALAVLLVVAYALYVRQAIESGEEGVEEPPEKLTLWPSSSPARPRLSRHRCSGRWR